MVGDPTPLALTLVDTIYIIIYGAPQSIDTSWNIEGPCIYLPCMMNTSNNPMSMGEKLVWR